MIELYGVYNSGERQTTIGIDLPLIFKYIYLMYMSEIGAISRNGMIFDFYVDSMEVTNKFQLRPTLWRINR